MYWCTNNTNNTWRNVLLSSFFSSWPFIAPLLWWVYGSMYGSALASSSHCSLSSHPASIAQQSELVTLAEPQWTEAENGSSLRCSHTRPITAQYGPVAAVVLTNDRAQGEAGTGRAAERREWHLVRGREQPSACDIVIELSLKLKWTWIMPAEIMLVACMMTANSETAGYHQTNSSAGLYFVCLRSLVKCPNWILRNMDLDFGSGLIWSLKA